MPDHPTIVVLRFANAIRVDLIDAPSDRQAVADFVGRTLRSTGAPSLPLIEAVTSPVPIEQLRAFVNGADHPVAEPAPPRPKVPMLGIMHALRAYRRLTIAGAKPEQVKEADKILAAFFDRYGVDLDFTRGGDG